MSSPIKITGELAPDPSMCMFHLEQPLVEDWTLRFSREDESHGSALAEHLFDVEGIARITVSGSTITVVKNTPAPWPLLAGAVGAAIRAAFASGQPLIAPEAIEALKAMPTDGIADTVNALFENEINPALASHGGFVRLAKVEGRDLQIEMGGGCQGCAASKMTMKYGVENAIRRVAPHVRHITDVTDHAMGENPYYKSDDPASAPPQN
ncbi:MAG: NifU family protein [Verrucomicrobia bacterium]|nr:NifU family protein [Kiritimatiellia bacterium]MCO6400797.1 NifU family protein [Verrucomicrobiota bacterium]